MNRHTMTRQMVALDGLGANTAEYRGVPISSKANGIFDITRYANTYF